MCHSFDRLGAPQAIIGEPVRQVAKADLRTEFRGQSGQTVGATARTDAAGNASHDEGVVGEAIPVVHGLTFAFCSHRLKRRHGCWLNEYTWR
jgi:hypothetical protein